MSRIPDRATALRCLNQIPRLLAIYEPESPKLREDVIDSIALLTRPNDAKWISVEDELPKHMEHVVLRNVNKWFSFIDDNVTHTGCLVEMLGRRHWSVNGVKGAQLMNEFTHWMPLPKQSSEGEE